MNEPEVYRLAIETMTKEIQYLAPAANLFDIYNANWPDNFNASRRRHKLREAIIILEAKIAACELPRGKDVSGAG